MNKFTARVALLATATIALTSCNLKRNDLPSVASATQVTVTDYTAITSRNPDAITVWTLTDASRIARLTQLVDAQSKGWRDDNAAILSEKSGIVMKFSGAGLNQIFTLYPSGFDNAYNTSGGNLWSRPDSVGPITQIKLLPDAQYDQLEADVRAIVKDVKPDATPKPVVPTAVKPTPATSQRSK